MKIQKKEVIKKLVSFTREEWDFIQSYKHANKIKTDMQAIKEPIMKTIQNKNDIILASLDRNHKILKKLADK